MDVITTYVTRDEKLDGEKEKEQCKLIMQSEQVVTINSPEGAAVVVMAQLRIRKVRYLLKIICFTQFSQ